MWVESQFHIGNDSIGVCVHRLDPDECERTAAMLAWLTLEAMRSGAESESGPWHEFVNGVLGQHVAFVDIIAGGASRLAALLVAQICPISSLLAPCHPDAALRDLCHESLFRDTSCRQCRESLPSQG